MTMTYIYRGVTVLKIGWIISTLLGAALFGAEPSRSHIARPPLRAPLTSIDLRPTPETALLPPPLAEERSDKPPQTTPTVADVTDEAAVRQTTTAEVIAEFPLPTTIDNRPVIRLYSSRGCQTCQWLKARIAQGKFSEFRWEFCEDADRPDWVQFTPAAHFEGADGQWFVYPRQDGSVTQAPTWSDDEFRQRWLAHHPGARLQAVGGSGEGNASAGKSLLDQLTLYAGPSGTITFAPDTPIRATMEDGTVLSYSRVTGKYKIVGGAPQIVFESPLPRVDAQRFWMHLGAQIQDARYEPPATLAIGTNRGRYRIKLEQVP
jgi:hypothetical protein